MDLIHESIWIGSLVDATDKKQLDDQHITAVVSLGCDPELDQDKFECLKFLDVLDMPEMNILPYLDATSRFIRMNIDRGRQVLVHCVHGQSRSATVIAAYLILHMNIDVRAALLLIKERHPKTCINPGFLSQLHLLDNRNIFRVEYALAMNSSDDDSQTEQSTEEFIRCGSCRFILGHASDILVDRCDDDFISSNVDPFWEAYRSHGAASSKNLHSLDESGDIAIRKPPFVQTQIDKCNISKTLKTLGCKNKKRSYQDSISERGVDADIHCPNCHHEVGYFKPKGLLLCRDHIKVDLYAFMKSKVYIEESAVAAATEEEIPCCKSNGIDSSVEEHTPQTRALRENSEVIQHMR